MSEASDDAQLPPQGEATPQARVDTGADADDVEVLAQSPEPVPPPRHDSVAPTSRKLAPPPKPKRDSNQPGSSPPAATDAALNLGSLKSPSTPAISFHEPFSPPSDAVAAALSGGDSLRSISEALANDAGAFSASETPTGGRPSVPRPRSQPVIDAPVAGPSSVPRPSDSPPRDKVPTVPDELPPSAAASPPKSSSIFAQRIISVGTPSERPPARASAPPPRPSAPPPAPTSDGDHEEVEPEVKRPSVPPLPAVIAVGIAAVDDEDPPEIPITTDFDDETPTHPSASLTPIQPPVQLSAPLIPDEPTPAPPRFAEAEVLARAEALAAEDLAPDSADRIPVEELSRDDAPSIPPDEAPPVPPPAPSGRPEAKPPQPPPPPKRPAPAAAAAEPAAPAAEARELASPETQKKTKQKRPWWEELFSEDFVRANWKVSDEQIKREVTFVEESLGVAPGGVVLDLGCGSGQHAVELASRGYGVVGYDLSLYQLALAADNAQERSQKLNFLQGDMREMAFEEMFDGIFCWNTSFGYFEEDKNFSVAERAFRALRPGGMFLVDVMNRDFVAAHTPSSVWFEGDSCVCMDDAVIDYFTSRLRVKRSVILDDGRTRECTYSVRLYSFHELGKLLHEVGFRVTEVSGHPATPGVFLGQASPRILMLAQRP